jgi:flagellar protein FliS
MSRAAMLYKQTESLTSVNSSSPIELILLVYERALENLRIGKQELENNQSGVENFTKASDFINFGLLASLDLEKGGEIAENLKVIYLWALHSIIEARLKKSPEKIDNVISVIDNLYKSWQHLK